MTGQKEEKKEKEKKEGEDDSCTRADRHMDQSKVVQEVLPELKMPF